MEERKKELLNEMYQIIASSSVELEKLEKIMNELFYIEDDNNISSQLILMENYVREFRIKFKGLEKKIFDKKFNIVELAKQNLKN